MEDLPGSGQGHIQTSWVIQETNTLKTNRKEHIMLPRVINTFPLEKKKSPIKLGWYFKA